MKHSRRLSDLIPSFQHFHQFWKSFRRFWKLWKNCRQYHMSTTNPQKLRKYSTSKECLQMKSGSWYRSCLILRHQKHRWNLNQRWPQGSCRTDTVSLLWKTLPKHQPTFSHFRRPLAQNHTGNPNGRGSFRKIPKLVPQKLVPIPSTSEWKLKAWKPSGSRESVL